MVKSGKDYKFLVKALKMQCRFIGIKYNFNFFKKNEFWRKYSWSSREEGRFRSWFIKEIRKDLKISKRAAIEEVNWFILQYSWTYRMPPVRL